jgi:hypothetical protein
MVLGLWSTGLMCVFSTHIRSFFKSRGIKFSIPSPTMCFHVSERSDIMLVIVGFMSVRYPFGFAISQLLCYTMMTGFNLFLYVFVALVPVPLQHCCC